MIYPLAAMLALVLIMFCVAFVARLNSVKSGHVTFEHYQLFEGNQPPKYVLKACNNLNNLFQVPPIFYAAIILALSKGIESNVALISAWGFVAARYAHTFVHITVNYYLARSAIFAISLLFLVLLWFTVLSQI